MTEKPEKPAATAVEFLAAEAQTAVDRSKRILGLAAEFLKHSPQIEHDVQTTLEWGLKRLRKLAQRHWGTDEIDDAFLSLGFTVRDSGPYLPVERVLSFEFPEK